MLPENEKIQKTQVNQNTRFQQIQQKLSNSLVSKFTNMVNFKEIIICNLYICLLILKIVKNKLVHILLFEKIINSNIN